MSEYESHNERDVNKNESGSGAEFSALEFRPSVAATRKYIDCFDSSCDSWALGDLYCKDLSKTDDVSDQMIVLEDKHAVLSWAAKELSASPAARTMLGEAEKQGWSVALEPLDGQDFHLDVPEKLIVLDDQDLVVSSLGRSEYFKNALLVTFIRALRDVWQEKRHGAFDEEYGVEEVLMLERVRAADLDVMAVLVGWELRSEGLGSLWRHLIGSEDGDVAMRFSGAMEREPASQFNGKALAAAFTQWFRHEPRVDNADHETLNYVDSVVQCADQDQVFGTKKLTPVGVEVLSCLPDRTAYLQGEGGEVLRNPLYAGLSDTINQAHFAQIVYDMRVVRVHGIPFRDQKLADMIFPDGEFTPEDECLKS